MSLIDSGSGKIASAIRIARRSKITKGGRRTGQPRKRKASTNTAMSVMNALGSGY